MEDLPVCHNFFWTISFQNQPTQQTTKQNLPKWLDTGWLSSPSSLSTVSGPGEKREYAHKIILRAVLRKRFKSAKGTPPPEGRLVVSHIKSWASKGNACGGGGYQNGEKQLRQNLTFFKQSSISPSGLCVEYLDLLTGKLDSDLINKSKHALPLSHRR